MSKWDALVEKVDEIAGAVGCGPVAGGKTPRAKMCVRGRDPDDPRRKVSTREVLSFDPRLVELAKARFREVHPELGPEVSFREVLDFAVERHLLGVLGVFEAMSFQLTDSKHQSATMSLETAALLKKVGVEFRVPKVQVVRALLGLLGGEVSDAS